MQYQKSNPLNIASVFYKNVNHNRMGIFLLWKKKKSYYGVFVPKTSYIIFHTQKSLCDTIGKEIIIFIQ